MYYCFFCCDWKGGLRLCDIFKECIYIQNVFKGEIVKCCKFLFGGGFVVIGYIDGIV